MTGGLVDGDNEDVKGREVVGGAFEAVEVTSLSVLGTLFDVIGSTVVIGSSVERGG